MIRCLIIEDEPVARDILGKYIEDTPNLSLEGECETAIEGLKTLQDKTIDLIFLDINMPKLSGISFLKSLSNPPKVILTTAYSEYALEGYELDVVDYLLKPFSFERFLKAVQKVDIPASGEASIIVKADGKTYRIDKNDILFAESLGDYVKLHTASNTLTFNKTLKSFLEELADNTFLRVHKSFLVSLSRIDFVEGNMIHIGTSEIPIGASHKEEFQNRFYK